MSKVKKTKGGKKISPGHSDETQNFSSFPNNVKLR